MSLDEVKEQSINQALAGNWQAAIDLNLEILSQNPKDVETLSRLAKAYTESGQKKLALKTYHKVLRLDPFNPIAKKNLARFVLKKTKKQPSTRNSKLDPDLFLEEPGKTKTVSLTKVGQAKTLAQLNIGNALKLIPRKQSLSVYDQNRHFLGKIPQDISQRLIKLMKKGNQYQAVVKAVEEKNLTIFIKETKQSKKNANIPSFPSSKEEYYSFVPKTVISRAPIEEIENQEE